MIVLAGGDLVLPDRILANGSLVLDGGRIVAIADGGKGSARPDPRGAVVIDVRDCFVLPGFIDVHVHGVAGVDTLDAGDPIGAIAAHLPRYGVSAFCPTTVACPPRDLAAVLAQVRQARMARPAASARVLPAHLESNFINPDYCGAQPVACLRAPRDGTTVPPGGDFSAADILGVVAAARADVGIVTMAPELPGALELVAALVAAGHRVSLGHSGASFDEAMAAIDAGASQATHLFNRMAPMTHRSPGIAGAVLARAEVTVEIICDGEHVHPAMARVAIAAKGVAGVMAISDGTAGAGLPVGSTARLGGRAIRVSERGAVLDGPLSGGTLAGGTLAGGTMAMDGVFRTIVSRFGMSMSDAAMLCSTTPARTLGLTGCGVIAEGAMADLVILDRTLRVVATFIDGDEVFRG